MESEVDYVGAGPGALSFERSYHSLWANQPALARTESGLGAAWSHSHAIRLEQAGNTQATVTISFGSGYSRYFTKPVGALIWSALNGADVLTQTASGWIYRRADDDATLVFDVGGRLQSEVRRNGWSTVYNYNGAGLLASIGNGFGSTLSLSYDSSGRLSTVASSDGRLIQYEHDVSGRLVAVTRADGGRRSYLYENAAFPKALTGIRDESGVRFSTFVYDTGGKAISSEHAGGVNRYQISSTGVTDPLGTYRSYSYSTAGGKLNVTNSGAPAAGDESDASSRTVDANGLVTAAKDFKQVIRTYEWDSARRLPLAVTSAAGTPEARSTTTQWHPTFSLPALITESGHTIAYIYDSVGNVLSKTVTDTATSVARTWSWTYNAQQLVETGTEPNGAVTTYTYDSFGNVLTAANALGHVTDYTYDTAKRVASSTAPNGLVTTYTYDLRDRLLTQTVGGLTSTFTYNPTGTLATLSLPTGLVLSYTYDAAHRLTGWNNNRGESGAFTLDGMGNRTAEQIKDSSGAVAWTLARSINNINRVTSTTEGGSQVITFGYDANGELIRVNNGQSQSTSWGLDSLRRVKTITNAANATATLTRNSLDDVVQATDFKGVATTYGRDALGNATSEASNDSGARSTQYDSLGLPSQIVDALGQATQIQRDALGRPTVLTFADGQSTTLSYDLTAASKGYLSQIVDRSGTTTYTRDGFGRVTLKQQALISGQSLQVGYAYLASGQLGSITYPGGGVLSRAYDATGRLVRLDWNGTPLVSAITWNPMGQPTGWSWAFVSAGLNASRSYDTAARLTATEFSSYVYNAAGRITSLTQQLFYPADSDPTHSAIASANTSWSVSYDAVGRITGFDNSNASGGDTASFGYDANGNRTASTRTLSGQTLSRSYSGEGNSNRLLGFTQTGSVGTSVSYAYNANGDLTSDGLRSYAYNAEGRLSDATTGASDTSPTTRYAYNALGQRVFKTEPQYPPAAGDETDPGFWASLVAFFQKLWTAPLTDSEKLGYGYLYDEEGTLIAESGTGGAQSAGHAQYIYLPTASGPLPVAVIVNGTDFYAVHADHLNTPRRLTDSSGQAVWQWASSAFGEDKPTLAKHRFANLEVTPNPGSTNAAAVKFNLRYPGQYFDEESGLHYNYFRSYSPTSGRYTQADPIGLDGGWNRFGYVDANPLTLSDPTGLSPAIGCALGSWLGPVGCGGGAALAGIATAAILNMTGDTSKPVDSAATSQICKPAIADVDPGDLCEQLALAEAKAGAGVPIMGSMNDEPRLIAHHGPGPWIKKQHIHTCHDGRKLVIHYFSNGRSNVELKFK